MTNSNDWEKRFNKNWEEINKDGRAFTWEILRQDIKKFISQEIAQARIEVVEEFGKKLKEILRYSDEDLAGRVDHLNIKILNTFREGIDEITELYKQKYKAEHKKEEE